MKNRTKIIKTDIEDYLSKILLVSDILPRALENYLKKEEQLFIDYTCKISKTEHDLDDIRRKIIEALYKYMLLPESRGDILGILEHLDDVANYSKSFFKTLEAQKPEFPEELHAIIKKISLHTKQGIIALVQGIEAYFLNKGYCASFASKVSEYERCVDELHFKAVKTIFSSPELGLAEKNHLSHILDLLDKISDIAEDVSERMVISSLKREI